MIKNLFLLALLSWVSISYAKHPIVQETIADAESFKVEKSVEEQEAQRSVAGEKIKKKKKVNREEVSTEPSDSGSDVRYWQYSE